VSVLDKISFFGVFPVVHVDRIVEYGFSALAVIGFQLAQQERQPRDLPPYFECFLAVQAFACTKLGLVFPQSYGNFSASPKL
jgi:hypothetical protein